MNFLKPFLRKIRKNNNEIFPKSIKAPEALKNIKEEDNPIRVNYTM